MLIFDSEARPKPKGESQMGSFNSVQFSKSAYWNQRMILLGIRSKRRKLKTLTVVSGALGLATVGAFGFPLSFDPVFLIPILLLAGGSIGLGLGKLVSPGALFEMRRAESKKDLYLREFLDNQQEYSKLWGEESDLELDQAPYFLVSRVDYSSIRG